MKLEITNRINITGEKYCRLLVKKNVLLKLSIIHIYEIRKNHISWFYKNRTS